MTNTMELGLGETSLTIKMAKTTIENYTYTSKEIEANVS